MRQPEHEIISRSIVVLAPDGETFPLPMALWLKRAEFAALFGTAASMTPDNIIVPVLEENWPERLRILLEFLGKFAPQVSIISEIAVQPLDLESLEQELS